MKNQVTKKELEKFIDGKCTPGQEARVLKWLKDNQKNELLQEIEMDWMELEDETISDEDIQLPFDKLEAQIANEDRVISIAPWLKVAASVLLLAIFSFIIYLYTQPQEQAFITKHIHSGMPSILTLDDGSKVTLSAGSSISYPVKFASNRQVYLEGEAYFDVSAGSEFTVHAGNVAAKTSNSSFNVSAFPEDNEVVVSVLEGEAEVVKGEKTSPLIKLRMPKTLPLTKLVPAVVVRNNEYMAYSKDDNSVSTGEDFDPKEVSAWKEGIIYFNNADSAKVLRKLERWYGVNIEVNGCLGQKVFNGEYNNKSLDEILMTISTSARSKLEYRREGDQVLIRGACI